MEKGWVPLPEIKLIDSPEKRQSLWQSKPLLAAISLYCIFALHDMAYTEVLTTSTLVKIPPEFFARAADSAYQTG